MKVILLQNIKSLGKKFDVKEVKDGYARNFLIPKGLARIATEQAIKELEFKKAAWEKEEKETKNKLETLANELANKEFQIAVKVGEKGEVFGSVNKNDIKALICAEIGADLRKYIEDKMEIDLERPVKNLGEHRVEIDLGRGVKTKIKLKVLG
jgi:large subunit ribosomal protein L9